MKFNKWTLALAAAGVLSLGSVAQAEEAENQVLTALSATTLSGYVSTSAIWKIGTGNTPLPGRAFDGPGKQDGFNLDVFSLKLEKPLDESQWSAGYLAQLWVGPDAVGFNPSVSGGGSLGAGEAIIKQAYVTLRAPVGNGIDFKLGHFNYIGGYESPEAGDNPNYSRSYGWTQEPASHTGVLATYHVNDNVTLSAGVANTVNNGVNGRAARLGSVAKESEKTYMGQFVLIAPDSFGFLQGALLSGTVVHGLNSGLFGGGGVTPARTTSWQIGGTIPTPVEGLAFGAAYDYTANSPGAGTGTPGVWLLNPAAESSYINVASFYASYQATEKLKLNARAEYTWATDGIWYDGGTLGISDKENKLGGLTLTADYSLWGNVISRVEYRWDHELDGSRPFGDSNGLATQKNAHSLALNVIYKF